MRTLHVLFALTAATALSACGGGGDSTASAPGSSPTPAGAPPSPAPAPSPGSSSTAQVAGMKLAQSLLYPSTDAQLVLVAGKSTYVQVDATNTGADASVPAGTLHVLDTQGHAVTDIALTPPTSLPATVPDVPGAQGAYTALLPGNLVKSGLRLKATLANGATTTVDPRVGGGVSIRLVQVPVQLGNATGTVVSGAAPYVLARLPLAAVTPTTHATYTSTSVTTTPATEADWDSAFDTVLGELADLETLEHAATTDYYAGFLPKETSGQVGLGYRPGRTVVVADWTNNAESVRRFLAHELGHNMSLKHAPCGVSDADPAYPYADAALGEPGRYIWGYLPATATWIDPRDAGNHDVMAYCGGSSFSDYNWRLMQVHLTPADQAKAAGAVAAPELASASASASAPAAQEMLLVGGEIRDGHATLRPFKALQGVPPVASGPYTLRLATAHGDVDVPFAARELDHASNRLHFSVAIANPGEILGATILGDGATLARVDAPAHAPRRAQAAGTAAVAATPAQAQLQATENGGRLLLAWNARANAYMTVTWVGATRQVLAQDLRGGSASLPLAGLPAGGSFEFSLSDGMNTVRATQAR